MEQINLDKKKTKKPSDKITLSECSLAKMNAWLDQLKNWQDIVKCSGSDLVNFILAKYPDVISTHDSRELMRGLFNQSQLPKVRKKRAPNKPSASPNSQAIISEKTSS